MLIKIDLPDLSFAAISYNVIWYFEGTPISIGFVH